MTEELSIKCECGETMTLIGRTGMAVELGEYRKIKGQHSKFWHRTGVRSE